VTLSAANHIVLAMLLTVTAVWLVNVCLRLAGRRMHWVAFWALFLGLPALAIYFLSNPTPRESVNSFNDLPREYALGVVAMFLWLVVLVLELVVFTALKIRDQRRTRGPAPDSTGPEL
jgi:carbon starvation protein CstA